MNTVISTLFLVFCSLAVAVTIPSAPPSVNGVFFPRVPVNTRISREEPCLILDSQLALGGSFESGLSPFSILTACSQNNNGIITIFNGNFSFETSSLICGESPIIAFNETDFPTFPLGNKAVFCQSDRCVAAFSEGQNVFLSASLIETEVEEIRRNDSILIPFLPTTVSFEFGEELGAFANRLLAAFFENRVDSVILRSIVFLATKRDQCRFPLISSCFCASSVWWIEIAEEHSSCTFLSYIIN